MNMKKRIVPMVGVVALTLLFASCDLKKCYCYENGYEEETYVNTDVPCSSYTTATRGCVEVNERMNPDLTAYK